MNLTAAQQAKLRLIRTAGIGAITARRLLLRYASAEAALANAQHWLKPAQVLCEPSLIEKECASLHTAGGWMVFCGEEDYPKALDELPDAPIVLSGFGSKQALHVRQVGMVGNRAASAAGLAWAQATATALARAGVGVCSGLARGVDTAAHSGALAAQGVTVAVVAGGVDHIYPPENAGLRARIMAEGGAVISEQPFGMAPTAQLFPQRNRIIAGLSVGVVVSEATRHSGSLITAECALNYGREVWAVPGSPGEARSAGPNWLLKNGATLIEGHEDILADMPRTPAPYVVKAKQMQPTLFAEAQTDDTEALAEDATPRAKLYGLLSGVPTTFDALLRQVGISEAEANMMLIELELDGHVVREADGRWRRG